MKIIKIDSGIASSASKDQLLLILKDFSDKANKLYRKNGTTVNIQHIKDIIISINNIGSYTDYIYNFHKEELKMPYGEYVEKSNTKKNFKTVLSDTSYYISRAISYLENAQNV
jgi:hypothetical protein